jgi:hypothetical protein
LPACCWPRLDQPAFASGLHPQIGDRAEHVADAAPLALADHDEAPLAQQPDILDGIALQFGCARGPNLRGRSAPHRRQILYFVL